MSMKLSSLSRGYGTLDGTVVPDVFPGSGEKDAGLSWSGRKVIKLPEISVKKIVPQESSELEKIGEVSNINHASVYNYLSKTESDVPKTFSTRRGALVLFADDVSIKRKRRKKNRRRLGHLNFIREEDEIIIDDITLGQLKEILSDFGDEFKANHALANYWSKRLQDDCLLDIRPGFSPNRYMASLSKLWEPAVVDKLLSEKKIHSATLRKYLFRNQKLPKISISKTRNELLQGRPRPYSSLSLPELLTEKSSPDARYQMKEDIHAAKSMPNVSVKGKASNVLSRIGDDTSSLSDGTRAVKHQTVKPNLVQITFPGGKGYDALSDYAETLSTLGPLDFDDHRRGSFVSSSSTSDLNSVTESFEEIRKKLASRKTAIKQVDFMNIIRDRGGKVLSRVSNQRNQTTVRIMPGGNDEGHNLELTSTSEVDNSLPQLGDVLRNTSSYAEQSVAQKQELLSKLLVLGIVPENSDSASIPVIPEPRQAPASKVSQSGSDVGSIQSKDDSCTYLPEISVKGQSYRKRRAYSDREQGSVFTDSSSFVLSKDGQLGKIDDRISSSKHISSKIHHLPDIPTGHAQTETSVLAGEHGIAIRVRLPPIDRREVVGSEVSNEMDNKQKLDKHSSTLSIEGHGIDVGDIYIELPKGIPPEQVIMARDLLAQESLASEDSDEDDYHSSDGWAGRFINEEEGEDTEVASGQAEGTGQDANFTQSVDSGRGSPSDQAMEDVAKLHKTGYQSYNPAQTDFEAAEPTQRVASSITNDFQIEHIGDSSQETEASISQQQQNSNNIQNEEDNGRNHILSKEDGISPLLCGNVDISNSGSDDHHIHEKTDKDAAADTWIKEGKIQEAGTDNPTSSSMIDCYEVKTEAGITDEDTQVLEDVLINEAINAVTKVLSRQGSGVDVVRDVREASLLLSQNIEQALTAGVNESAEATSTQMPQDETAKDSSENVGRNVQGKDSLVLRGGVTDKKTDNDAASSVINTEETVQHQEANVLVAVKKTSADVSEHDVLVDALEAIVNEVRDIAPAQKGARTKISKRTKNKNTKRPAQFDKVATSPPFQVGKVEDDKVPTGLDNGEPVVVVSEQRVKAAKNEKTMKPKQKKRETKDRKKKKQKTSILEDFRRVMDKQEVKENVQQDLSDPSNSDDLIGSIQEGTTAAPSISEEYGKVSNTEVDKTIFACDKILTDQDDGVSQSSVDEIFEKYEKEESSFTEYGNFTDSSNAEEIVHSNVKISTVSDAKLQSRKLAAEKRRQKVEKRRLEKQLEKQRLHEEAEREERLKQEAEEEKQRRIEEYKKKREQEEMERQRLEEEESENLRKLQSRKNQERRQKEEERKKIEEMLAQLRLEEEMRKERERIAHEIELEMKQREEEMLEKLAADERRLYLEKQKAEEEERRRLEEEKRIADQERKEAEEKERERVLRELEELRSRIRARNQFIDKLRKSGLFLSLEQKLTRSFTFSYFEELPGLLIDYASPDLNIIDERVTVNLPTILEDGEEPTE